MLSSSYMRVRQRAGLRFWNGVTQNYDEFALKKAFQSNRAADLVTDMLLNRE